MEPEKTKLLIVDDEPSLRRALRTALAGSGFAVFEARNGEEALAAFRQNTPDVVLLDINMPGMSGMEVCRKIRSLSARVGIVMVTVRDTEDDKVQALEAGADDFITKPYRLREMVARLHSVLRRANPPPEGFEPVLKAGILELDPLRRLVTRRGQVLHLSPKEFDLLAYLFKNQGVPITHARLLKAVWGPEYGGELEYLRSYVRMLRKKIETDPSQPEYILTEPWLGYRFQNPEQTESPTAVRATQIV